MTSHHQDCLNKRWYENQVHKKSKGVLHIIVVLQFAVRIRLHEEVS
jgi:hypothetical protein